MNYEIIKTTAAKIREMQKRFPDAVFFLQLDNNYICFGEDAKRLHTLFKIPLVIKKANPEPMQYITSVNFERFQNYIFPALVTQYKRKIALAIVEEGGNPNTHFLN